MFLQANETLLSFGHNAFAVLTLDALSQCRRPLDSPAGFTDSGTDTVRASFPMASSFSIALFCSLSCVEHFKLVEESETEGIGFIDHD